MNGCIRVSEFLTLLYFSYSVKLLYRKVILFHKKSAFQKYTELSAQYSTKNDKKAYIIGRNTSVSFYRKNAQFKFKAWSKRHKMVFQINVREQL